MQKLQTIGWILNATGIGALLLRDVFPTVDVLLYGGALLVLVSLPLTVYATLRMWLQVRPKRS